MYPQNMHSDDEAGYHLDYQSLGTEDDTSPLPQIYDPERFRSWEYTGGQAHTSRTDSGSSPLLAPITQTNVRYPSQHSSALLHVEAETYNSLPHLNPYTYIDTSPSILSGNSFERSTAASEYRYSEYDIETTKHMLTLTHHMSCKPSFRAESYISRYPNAPEIQDIPFASYLHIQPEGSHRPNSSYLSSSNPPTSTETNTIVAQGEVVLRAPSATPGLSHNVSRPSLEPQIGTAYTKKQKTRKPFEPERRLEVRRMRQTGACFRCRWLKKPCGVGTPCPQCINVRGRVWTYPCMRVNMTDLTGFSDLGLQRHQRGFLNTSILDWTGVEATIQFTHKFGGLLSISAEEIIPRDVQALVWKWPLENERAYGAIWRWFDSTSIGRCYETTTMPFAIRKFHISEAELDMYLDCDRGHQVSNAGPGVLACSLDGSGFTKAMIRNAWDYAEATGVTMIKKALRIKNAVYLQNYVSQCELDVPSTDEPGMRAIAPVFVQVQLDLLIDGRRAELEKEVLAELQRTIFSRQRKCWLSIFFTIYILLTTLEETLWSHYAWKTKGFSSTDFSYERAQEIADAFVSVFRAINQGNRPFIKLADGEEIVKVLNEEYGTAMGAIFHAVAALISTQSHGSLLLQRKDATFQFRDQFSLEGKFSSLLLLL